MITSPYNFVPVSDDVFRPDWGMPSHDVPFSDGITGTLEIKLTATSPIYIRGSEPKPKDDQLRWREENPSLDSPYGKWTDFYRLQRDGPFAIPATSWRGMIRNVVKIAAFGSIKDAVPSSAKDDERFAVRDLQLPKYQKQFVKGNLNTEIKYKSHGGWLRIENDQWIIYPSSYQRVEHSELENYSTTGSSRVTVAQFQNAQNMDNSVSEKYTLWERAGLSLDVKLKKGPVVDQSTNGRHRKTNRRTGQSYFLRLVYGLAELREGDEGRIVFTGQPSNQKHMEFVFDPLDTCCGIKLTSEQIRRFESTHETDSEAWHYWRPRFESGEAVPVFWLGDQKNLIVQDFGLAQMFRLPSSVTVRDGIPHQHFDGGLDIAERLFGSLGNDPLKGRVFFGILESPNKPSDVRFSRVVKTVLGAPRPSFYPAYLQQPTYSVPEGRLIGGKRDYQTWLSEKVKIRGWKRYHVPRNAPDSDREMVRQHPLTNVNGDYKYDTATAFRPLKAGATFKGKLRFHNLKRAELGALVWALTWGGKNSFRHSLGMGKSLGLGSCFIEIENPDLCWVGDPQKESEQPLTLQACQDEFEKEMNNYIPDWKNSIPMGELFAMANPTNADALSRHATFPTLSLGVQNGDQFRTIKHSGEVLPRTTEIIQGNQGPDWPTDCGKSSPPSPRRTKCNVEMIEKRGKPRARDLNDGFPGAVSNLKDHPEATIGTKWRAYRYGSGSECPFELIEPYVAE